MSRNGLVMHVVNDVQEWCQLAAVLTALPERCDMHRWEVFFHVQSCDDAL